MVKLLLFLTVLLTSVAQAQVYALLQGGYSQLNQQKPSANNVYPTGTTLGGGIGFRKNFYEFEGSFQKFSLAGEIDHDGKSNTMTHSQASLLLAFNFYFNKRFYARFGYGFHKVDQTLDKKVSEASMEGARKAYDLQEDKVTDGVLYGAGYVIYDGKRLSIYTQFENMHMSSINATAWNAGLGFKVYLD